METIDVKCMALAGGLIVGSLAPSLHTITNVIATVGIGAAIIAIGYNGQIDATWAAMKEDKGYLYFIGAIGVLGVLHSYAPVGPVADALLIMAVLGVMLRYAPAFSYADIKKALTA